MALSVGTDTEAQAPPSREALRRVSRSLRDYFAVLIFAGRVRHVRMVDPIAL